jgi:hypothetical protein
MKSPINTQQLSRYISTISKVNTILRLLLKLSILCLLISSILVTFFNEYLILKYEFLDSFIYISVVCVIWTGNLSIGAILITAILHKLDQQAIWMNIKRETILLLALILSVVVFYFCGVWVFGA